jgi:tetratricopeptide (TPR) repeat protein
MRAEIAYEAGRQKSNLDYLAESKNSWEEAIKLTRGDAIVFYKAQLGLAKTLQLLYELEESKIEYIEQSIVAYRAALGVKEFKDSNIENWAETQMIWALLFKQSMSQMQNLINEAIFAFETALEQFKQEKDRQKWAETKSNLGGALQKLGELTGDIDLMGKQKLRSSQR